MTVTHPLALAWLDRVERLAADLPADVRSELLADLREHIHAALATPSTDDDVARVLERLGDPAEVVAAARADGELAARSAPPPAPGTQQVDGLLGVEVAALAALVVAGLAGVFMWPVAIMLWVVGVVLVAVGGRWRGGEVVGMVLLPVAWLFPVASLVVPVGSVSQSCVVTSGGVETCTTEQAGMVGPWVLLGSLVVLVLIVLGTRWLARAPQGRPRR